jgi:HlyD family secretion protein
MLEAGLIAQSDLDAAKAAYDASVADLDLSQAALRQAETNLGYAKIFSPIDGEVVARQYDIGQTVAASFQAPTLFIIAKDLTKMQVQADVDQSDIGQIKVDEAARFTVDAYPEQQFRGRIAQVRLNATVNQNVITYPVMIEVPNPDGKLRPSMTANVTIEVAQVKDVLRVPNAALRFRPETKEGAAKAATPRTAGTPGATPTAATATAQQTPPAGAPPSFDRGAAGLGERGQGMAGVERAFSAGAGGKPAARRQAQTVYVVDDKGALRPVTIRTGITDGHYTQVLQTVDGTLNPGDKVAIGLATAKVDSGQQGARPPGMGRF